MRSLSLEESKKELANNRVGVMPTDTLYGLLGTAKSQEVVERIYALKKRDSSKPLIILVSEWEHLRGFGVRSRDMANLDLEYFWPGKVSIILPCPGKDYEHLKRGGESLAFRYPAHKGLRSVIEETGPLVAPSANPEGDLPAKNTREAYDYFGEGVDFYVDEGELSSDPSTLISIAEGKVTVEREGAVKIKESRFFS